MAYSRIIRNFTVFADGVSYFGLAREAKMPDPKIMTAAHRGAGMDGPVGIDMGLEGLSAEVTFAEWPAAVLTSLGTLKRWVMRPAARSDEGVDQTNIVTLAGLVTSHEFGGLKPGAGLCIFQGKTDRQGGQEIRIVLGRDVPHRMVEMVAEAVALQGGLEIDLGPDAVLFHR